MQNRKRNAKRWEKKRSSSWRGSWCRKPRSRSKRSVLLQHKVNWKVLKNWINNYSQILKPRKGLHNQSSNLLQLQKPNNRFNHQILSQSKYKPSLSNMRQPQKPNNRFSRQILSQSKYNPSLSRSTISSEARLSQESNMILTCQSTFLFQTFLSSLTWRFKN